MRIGPSMRFVSALAAMLVTTTACTAREKQEVTISYVIAPVRDIPEGLHTVAVIDAGVETQGVQQDEREAKWSTIGADMVESALQAARREFNSDLTIAKRRATRQILMEKDLRLAGLVEGEQATKAGKLLNVQGLITSEININIDTQRTTSTEIDWGSVIGSAIGQAIESNQHSNRSRVRRPRRPDAIPAGPRRTTASLHTKEVEEIIRNLTVQCSFTLIDAVTGEAILQHSTKPIQKTDTAKPEPLAGPNVSEADLDPIDDFIGELVERAVQDFVGMLVPQRVTYRVELIGHGDEGERAIRAIRGENYELAFNLLELSWQEDDEEFDTMFALAAVCELMHQPDSALRYYRQAASMKDAHDDEIEQAMAAAARLKRHIPRIIDPNAKPPAAKAENADTATATAPE